MGKALCAESAMYTEGTVAYIPQFGDVGADYVKAQLGPPSYDPKRRGIVYGATFLKKDGTPDGRAASYRKVPENLVKLTL